MQTVYFSFHLKMREQGVKEMAQHKEHRGPGFSSLHPFGGSQLSVTPAPRHWMTMASAGSSNNTHLVHTYTDTQAHRHTQLKTNLKNMREINFRFISFPSMTAEEWVSVGRPSDSQTPCHSSGCTFKDF